MADRSSKKPSLFGFPDWLRSRFSDTHRHTILWVITGVVCGFVAVAFHLSIDIIAHFVMGAAERLEESDRPWMIALLIGAPTLGGLITGLAVKKYGPGVAGSGIPQTKHAFHMKFGYLRMKDAAVRFVIGAISVGSGMSLGREGPTVHICSAVASKIARTFGLAKSRVQSLVPAGMGAGIAAAFNTPIAAMFFVFEELYDHFSSKAIFGILIAVVLAGVVERLCLGENAAYVIANIDYVTDWWMLICLPLGIICALLGHFFVGTLLAAREWFKESKWFPSWLQPAFGGLLVGVIGTSVLVITGHHGIFGLGYQDLVSALNGKFDHTFLVLLVLLLVGKFTATILAYASGGSGGLFAPVLFIGGILGALVAALSQRVFYFEASAVGGIALLGMGAFFAAVIRCPMTSIMIVFELTRNYTIILPLMAGNILAWGIATRLRPVGMYDALLVQDKISIKSLPSYQGQQDWKNLPVSTIMTFDPHSTQSQLTGAENLKALGEIKKHAYPIVDAEKNLVGMITHHSLLDLQRENDMRPLGEIIANQKLISVEPETSIRATANVLVTKDVRQVPVVSKGTSRLHGIVTLHDIARQQNVIMETIAR